MESKKKLKNHFRNIFKNLFVMFILCSKNKLNLGELPSKQSHFIFSFPTIKLEKVYVYTEECQNSNLVPYRCIGKDSSAQRCMGYLS